MYWVSTILLALMLVLSSGSYLLSNSTIEGVRALGFPDYFRIQLAILKIIAAIVLLVPALPIMLKDWAYAGIGLFLLTAFVAHYAHKDPVWINMINVLLFAILIISRMSYPKEFL